MAINTRLGWVLLGKLMGTSESNTEVCNLSLQTEPELEFVLKRFWETESVPSPDLCTQDEDCESLFSNNHGRDSHGRYWVKLPFRQHRPLLGESREKALRRFFLLERKLCKNVKLYDQYRGFMKEYEHLNHMERVPIAEVKRELCRCYYMPHHPVIREQSTTTKMRVVFDASAKSENNVSLNQFLHKGPKIQQDVFFILLRFRTYPVAITADIEKMYRQIKIHPEDADYQRILWRPSPEEPVVDYRLLTVTYGTTSAPFLAMRTLQQLAEDEGQNYPEASRVTLNDFYVDDLLTGAQTIAETKELIDQLKDLMKKGGFHLRKWNSNCHEIVSHVEEMNEEKKINLEKGAISKILGIVWDHVQDTFRVNITLPEEVVTKRDILSNIARIFDPLGFLSPTTVALKIIMQELWRGGTGWDEHIQNDIKEKWNNFRAELLKLEDLSIPRYVWACEGDRDVQLHGFCDASSVAYSAVCYLRTVSLDGQVHISMLAAKTRVAPCKSLTLPRLELSAALLLSQLYRSVVDSLKIDIGRAYLWSDSQISLSWIKSDPNRWKTFIHNRVVKIQQLSDRNSWRHVSGKDNPADCASRGIMPAALSGHTLWWQGPTWLKDNNFVQNQDNCYGRECHEEEKRLHANLALNTHFLIFREAIGTKNIFGRSGYSLLHADERQQRETRSWMAFLIYQEIDKSTQHIITESRQDNHNEGDHNEEVIVAVYACGVDVEKGPIRQQLWNAPPLDNVESWFGAQSRMIPGHLTSYSGTMTAQRYVDDVLRPELVCRILECYYGKDSVRTFTTASFIRNLLELGVEVNFKDYWKTALHYASDDWRNPKRGELMKLLIEFGADVNSRVYRTTPLMNIANIGNIFEAQMLIRAGASINAKDDDFLNMLDHAILGNNIEMTSKTSLLRTPRYRTPLYKGQFLFAKLPFLQFATLRSSIASAVSSEEMLSSWWDSCQREVATILDHKLGQITLHSYLVEPDLNTRAGYIYNENNGIKEHLESNMTWYKDNLKIYSSMIEEYYKEDIKRVKTSLLRTPRYRTPLYKGQFLFAKLPFLQFSNSPRTPRYRTPLYKGQILFAKLPFLQFSNSPIYEGQESPGVTRCQDSNCKYIRTSL
ncbi:hypothetical protein LAZ67_21000879 [Cordylochernes scorpioides]|uniref:Uncharacterized protein n=1 Tax=Cordylochernes scorpioides TaxID=51811 RepID=A0ABY6LQH3_9ARAC|nr:hypothetical protein LAZ67_21000879 [Cordylochernes scorpioides]